MILIWSGLAAFVGSLLLTRGLLFLYKKYGPLDVPDESRKIHKKPVALGGGVAIFITLAIVLFVLLFQSDILTSGAISSRHYAGFLLGGLILMIGGYLDDRFRLPPYLTIISPVLAALSAIWFGIEVNKLSNPLGGVITLLPWQSDILVFIWLLAVMYTTKFLDGLDGLSTGISSVGTLMILLLTLTTAFFQSDVALLAAVSLGALLGFLFFNFHPARFFLGEGGSTFVGFLLGTLAVISGGKLATALLVLIIPLLDLFWVVLRRWKKTGFVSIFRGDQQHLHHRLLQLGWGQRKIVFFYVAIATMGGVMALFMQSHEKLISLTVLVAAMIIFTSFFVHKNNIYVS